MTTPTDRMARVPHTASPPPDAPTVRLRSWVVSLVLLGVVSAALSGFYLWIYPARGFTVPIGWDVSEYIWRTTMAQAVGVGHTDIPIPSPVPDPKAGRPGFPVIGATLSSLTHVSLFRVAMVLPTVMAVIIGLAAAAFVAGVLKRPRWEAVVAALAVSLSPFVIRLMQPEGYLDNMFAAAVFLAAATALGLAVERRGALPAAVLLLGSGAAIHWDFFLFIAGALGVAAVLLVPWSWRQWRSGERALLDTPAARIAEAVAGGAAVGLVTIFGILGNALPRVRSSPAQYLQKLRQDIPKYLFPITIPAALVGVWALVDQGRRQPARRPRVGFVLAFLLGWGAVVLGGYLAFAVLGLRTLPADRFLAFALGVPVLGALGLLWLARMIRRLGRRAGASLTLAAVVAGLFVAGGLSVEAKIAHEQWFSTVNWTDPAKLRDAATALAYLDAAKVPVDRPVVFIVDTNDWYEAGLMGHTMRAALPADRILHLYVYDGSAQSFLARRPIGTAVSASYFRRMRSVYGRNPVALILASYDDTYFGQWSRLHPSSVVNGTVAVVRGPAPPRRTLNAGPPVGPPIGPISPILLVLLAGAILCILGLVGLPWTAALLGRWLRPLETLATAPAVGVGALVIGGIVIDRLGFRLVGVAGALTPVIVGAGGVAVWLVVRRRARRAPVASG